MSLEVSWGALWTLSCGLSQFHGHNSWLVCEVALDQLDFDQFHHASMVELIDLG